jgi:uncharacterized DUF497 family protein
MKIAGFDWDAGNWPKCGKHGVSRTEIEQVMLGAPDCRSDPYANELRQRAIGKTQNGRSVFLVFTLRMRGGRIWIRPISARYMHAKEIAHYEREIEASAGAAQR